MNGFMAAEISYNKEASLLQAPRQAEYAIFAKITHRLSATEKHNRKAFSDYVFALHQNRKLWSAIASDVADGENQLPPPLRAQIFYLAEFTHAYTSKILSDNAALQPLIDVNLAIMRGLKGGSSK